MIWNDDGVPGIVLLSVGLRGVLHRTVDLLVDSRHAARQAGGRPVRAVDDRGAVRAVRETRATGRVLELAADGRNVRDEPRGGAGVSQRLGAVHATGGALTRAGVALGSTFNDVSAAMIATVRRLEYAMGYLSLGLLREAEEELEAVQAKDRDTPDVVAARLELNVAAKRWGLVAEQARALLQQDQDNVGAWVALGCAVRRVENIAAARDLLLRAEPLHGDKHAVIHYNLACYSCLLGEHETAKARLAIACRMDPSFKHTALADPDLEAIGDAVRALSAKERT